MGLKNSIRVMVVDDMSTSRAIITQCLDEIGIAQYNIENSGESALETLSVNPVHLVLSDYNMPGMDGLQLLQAIRQTPSIKQIGFILVTGKATPDIVQQGKQFGLNNLIKKPFTTDSMKGCIERVVGAL